MFKLVRTAVSAAALGALLLLAVFVPLGKRTLWGHLQQIWATEATRDLVSGAEMSAAPAVERVKRAVEAGVREAAKPTPDGGTPSDTDTAEGPSPGRP